MLPPFGLIGNYIGEVAKFLIFAKQGRLLSHLQQQGGCLNYILCYFNDSSKIRDI